MGQQRVLLALVETVDLVDEEDRAEPLFGTYAPRFLDCFAQLGDTGEHGGDLDEARFDLVSEAFGDRCFASPRRSPEDHAGHPSKRQRPREDRSRSRQMRLADDVDQPLWTHPFSERHADRIGFGSMLEQVHQTAPQARGFERWSKQIALVGSILRR